jgi:hypothetical protein
MNKEEQALLLDKLHDLPNAFNLWIFDELQNLDSKPLATLRIKDKSKQSFFDLTLQEVNASGIFFNLKYLDENGLATSYISDVSLLELISVLRGLKRDTQYRTVKYDYTKVNGEDLNVFDLAKRVTQKHSSLKRLASYYTADYMYDLKDVICFLMSKNHHDKSFLIVQAGIRAMDPQDIAIVKAKDKKDITIYDQVLLNLLRGQLSKKKVADATAIAVKMLKSGFDWNEVFNYTLEK